MGFLNVKMEHTVQDLWIDLEKENQYMQNRTVR